MADSRRFIDVAWNTAACSHNPGKVLPPSGTIVQMEIPPRAFVRDRMGRRVPRPYGPFRAVYFNGVEYFANTAHLTPMTGNVPASLVR